jgi:NAD(P) transhydrogenase subunit alpha
VTALLDLLLTDDGVAPDFTDEIVAASCITRTEGDI